ncbi:MAG TPA: sulfotransferase [Kineosporiaceae bacterium]
MAADRTTASTTGRDGVGTVEDLHASASRITGLDDFGDDDYLDGLQVLLDSFRTEADLTPLGTKVVRAFLRGALVARLLSEAAWKAHPEHDDVPVSRPIVVTGLPRTGTTALHRLLAADPGHQGLELWLAESPQPRPPRETWGENPVYQLIDAGVRKHREEHPGFSGIHAMSASDVEECWQLLRQSMRSISYECLAHLPSYSAWLAEQDWTPAYRRHRRNLQLIGLPDAGRRWVLKNPSHLFAVDALLAVYPDALVVQLHRDPVTAIASVCSLNAEASAGWSGTFRGEVIGRDQLELWSRGLARFAEQRARHDPALFVDVDYTDFVRDPLGTLEMIYERAGTRLSDAARAAVVEQHRRGRAGAARPSHQYRLVDVGLTEQQVRDRFAGYVGVAGDRAGSAGSPG